MIGVILTVMLHVEILICPICVILIVMMLILIVMLIVMMMITNVDLCIRSTRRNNN